MKAYLIDPCWRTIVEVDSEGTLASFFKLLEADYLLEGGMLRDDAGNGSDVLLFNEQGGIVDDPDFFQCDLYRSMVRGKALWIGAKDDGTFTDASVSLQVVITQIHFDFHWTKVAMSTSDFHFYIYEDEQP